MSGLLEVGSLGGCDHCPGFLRYRLSLTPSETQSWASIATQLHSLGGRLSVTSFGVH